MTLLQLIDCQFSLVLSYIQSGHPWREWLSLNLLELRGYKMPTKDYIAMLDIKAIVRKWQDLEISDSKALLEIDKISIARQNQAKE